MDREIIGEKLEALRFCVQRLRTKCPEEAEALQHDADIQDIVAMNLARAVQLCVDIATHIVADSSAPAPNTMAESFGVLRQLGYLSEEITNNMKKAVGFRNIAVHAYDNIDWHVVHEICSHRLTDFEQFAAAIQLVMDKE
jgi:uncharacterized protein YutE (UPF0331/DUF86 family)